MAKDHERKYEASYLACHRIKVIHIPKGPEKKNIISHVVFFLRIGIYFSSCCPSRICRIRMGYQLRWCWNPVHRFYVLHHLLFLLKTVATWRKDCRSLQTLWVCKDVLHTFSLLSSYSSKIIPHKDLEMWRQANRYRILLVPRKWEILVVIIHTLRINKEE